MVKNDWPHENMLIILLTPELMSVEYVFSDVEIDYNKLLSNC